MIVISLRSLRRDWGAWTIRFLFIMALIYGLSTAYHWLFAGVN